MTTVEHNAVVRHRIPFDLSFRHQASMLLLQEDHRGLTAKHELYDFESSGRRLFLRLYSLPPAKMCIWA
jgi:hypothetical protein